MKLIPAIAALAASVRALALALAPTPADTWSSKTITIVMNPTGVFSSLAQRSTNPWLPRK